MSQKNPLDVLKACLLYVKNCAGIGREGEALREYKNLYILYNMQKGLLFK